MSPPFTLVGLRVNEARLMLPEPEGFIVSAAVCVVPPYDAEIVAVCLVVTAFVVIGNIAVVAPAGTMTVDGTVAAEELLASVTLAPPGGKPLSVTVPCDPAPPVRLAGFSVRDETVIAVGAVMYSVLVKHVPP